MFFWSQIAAAKGKNMNAFRLAIVIVDYGTELNYVSEERKGNQILWSSTVKARYGSGWSMYWAGKVYDCLRGSWRIIALSFHRKHLPCLKFTQHPLGILQRALAQRCILPAHLIFPALSHTSLAHDSGNILFLLNHWMLGLGLRRERLSDSAGRVCHY